MMLPAATTQGLEIEDDAQRCINTAHLVEAEEPDAVAEPPWVNCCGLLGKYPGVHAVDLNFGTKTGGTSRCGCWRNQPGRQRQLI